MGIEWSDNFDPLFSVFIFQNLEFFVEVHNTLDGNWLHGIFLLELGKVFASPEELLAIFRGDINGRLAQKLFSIFFVIQTFKKLN